jgi:hypothetical protein
MTQNIDTILLNVRCKNKPLNEAFEEVYKLYPSLDFEVVGYREAITLQARYNVAMFHLNEEGTVREIYIYQ